MRTFSRRGRSGRTTFRRPFRRGSGVRNVTEPRRWIAANFYFTHQLASETPADYVCVATPLVCLASQYEGVFNAGQSLLMESEARRIEIGGITWCNAWRPGTNGLTDCLLQPVWSALYTDQVDIDGAPFYLPDFDTSHYPIATAPTESNTTWPTRIHWRWFGGLNATSQDLTASINDPIIGAGGIKNLRLKKALDVNQGLFFATAFQNQANSPVAHEVDYSGTLYWRLRK